MIINPNDLWRTHLCNGFECPNDAPPGSEICADCEHKKARRAIQKRRSRHADYMRIYRSEQRRLLAEYRAQRDRAAT